MTHPIANNVIGRLAALKSNHEVVQAELYKIGGRKIKKTKSGASETGGRPGTRPIPMPANTRRIGYGILTLSVISASAVTTARRIIMISIVCIEKQSTPVGKIHVFLYFSYFIRAYEIHLDPHPACVYFDKIHCTGRSTLRSIFVQPSANQPCLYRDEQVSQYNSRCPEAMGWF
jgi:hypothetical protein